MIPDPLPDCYGGSGPCTCPAGSPGSPVLIGCEQPILEMTGQEGRYGGIIPVNHREMNMNTTTGFWESLLSFLADLALPIGVVLLFGLILYLMNRVMAKRLFFSEGHQYRRQLVNAGAGLVGIIALVLVLPIGGDVQGQLLSLIGIIVSAAIALSSTTVLGNTLAGFMLRIVKGFRTGDFIRVNDHFGRVSERGIFHTEIQTEQRELTTLPNLYLVQNPVTTIRSSGTAISTSVSLGYDVSRTVVEKLLKEAALQADLTDPFVHVMELGDHAVTYRISGILAEVKGLITAHSRLRSAVLDTLHGGDVEIVSPTFMYRRSADEKRFIPDRTAPVDGHSQTDGESLAEDLVFDKADEAESREQSLLVLRERLAEIEEELEEKPDPEREKRLTAIKARIVKRLEILTKPESPEGDDRSGAGDRED